VVLDDQPSGRHAPGWVASPRRRGLASRAFLDAEGRLRIGWRILAYLATWSVAVGVVSDVIVGRQPAPARQLLALVAIPVTITATYGFRRWVDRRDWAGIGLPWPGRRQLAASGVGFLLGVAVITVLVAVEWAAGWVQVTGTELADRGAVGAATLLCGGLGLQAAAGFTEELAFRGYLFRNLAERLTVGNAALGVGVLFGAAHLPGVASPAFGLATLVGGIAISCLWTLTRLSTGTLWTAIGMHVAWNWAERWLFGLTTAGQPDYGNALVHLRQDGPALVVGQEHWDGFLVPETGLLFTVAEVLLLLGYWLLVRRRGAMTRRGAVAA
jgi:membrane protease YdiL (CAAX protease family)